MRHSATLPHAGAERFPTPGGYRLSASCSPKTSACFLGCSGGCGPWCAVTPIGGFLLSGSFGIRLPEIWVWGARGPGSGSFFPSIAAPSIATASAEAVSPNFLFLQDLVLESQTPGAVKEAGGWQPIGVSSSAGICHGRNLW